jgi:hypothetical protein
MKKDESLNMTFIDVCKRHVEAALFLMRQFIFTLQNTVYCHVMDNHNI